MNGEESRVTFTVKEMFVEVDKKLEYIIAQLTTKAERADVENLSDRMDALEEEVRTFKRVLKIGGSALAAAATVFIAIIQTRGGL